jgi:DNA polymerase-3 subunit epsilon
VELTRAKAAAYLAAGPAPASELLAHACGIPALPNVVADHMASALFAGHPEFARDLVTGLWKHVLVRSIPSLDGASALSDLSYAVVDVEATGGRPERGRYGPDRVIEVAVVTVKGGAVQDVYETLINPQRPIPRFVSRLTGIWAETLSEAPRFADVAQEVARRLDGHVFVAHNVKFDWRFLSAELARAGAGRLRAPRLCTVRLARRLLPHLRRRSLDHVAHHYDVEITARHRAGGDAVATARCLIRMLRDADRQGIITWSDVQSLLALPAPARPKRHSALPTQVQHEESA